MFDIAWSELAVIALVALVVVGPKEFPLLMRKAGHWSRRARLAYEGMKQQLSEAADAAELAELQRQTDEITAAARNMSPIIEEQVNKKPPV